MHDDGEKMPVVSIAFIYLTNRAEPSSLHTLSSVLPEHPFNRANQHSPCPRLLGHLFVSLTRLYTPLGDRQ